MDDSLFASLARERDALATAHSPLVAMLVAGSQDGGVYTTRTAHYNKSMDAMLQRRKNSGGSTVAKPWIIRRARHIVSVESSASDTTHNGTKQCVVPSGRV